MKHLLYTVMTAVFFIVMLSAGNVSAEDLPDDDTGPAYVLMEAHTGSVIEKKRENDRIPAGPFNKLMTLLIVMEKISAGELSEDTELTASESDCSAAGAVIWLEKGEKIKVSELLRGVIEGNACDAASVLAGAVCGTKAEFTELMNVKAVKLGMKDTHYTSPAENDDAGQYTTAYDTAVLARALLDYPQLTEFMTSWHDYIREGKTELVNENRLVRTYSGVTGMKAGHSPESGYSVVLTAERGEKSFISVVLGCSDDDSRFTIARELAGRGFSGYITIVPGFSADDMKPLSVRHGCSGSVMLRAAKISDMVIPGGAEDDVRAEVFLPEYIDAPVRAGQKIGILAFYNGRTLLYETPLVTEKSVEKITFLSSFKKIMRKLFK